MNTIRIKYCDVNNHQWVPSTMIVQSFCRGSIALAVPKENSHLSAQSTMRCCPYLAVQFYDVHWDVQCMDSVWTV